MHRMLRTLATGHSRGSSVWKYFAAFVRHPRRTWSDLLADSTRLQFGFQAVLLVALGYALTIAGIAWSGGTPSPPWLVIPPAEYFTWEAFFVAPVTFACWILAAGVAHLLSRLVGGRGTFDDTLALLGFAVALPTLVSLIPDATRALLTSLGVMSRAAWEQAVAEPGTPDFVFLWTYMIAYVLGLLWLCPLAVGAAHGLGPWRAMAVGLLTAVVYQGTYVIFVR